MCGSLGVLLFSVWTEVDPEGVTNSGNESYDISEFKSCIHESALSYLCGAIKGKSYNVVKIPYSGIV